MGQNDVIESVRRYKQLVLDNLGQARVYLFGSYSKGTAREDSDIDVAVVVPKVEDDFLKTSSMLWMLTWNINTLIEPVLIEEGHPSPLYDEIMRTGVLV
ncbi:MAG: nucleotidyltransferase domain-containing protein [Bacteroidales bacterium]|nr:nucleotidyltransferase domain-containing protein [Bacteroidales bacterium]MBR0531914.1 nucleotidyltransferase domain-containing protein [Bacteroidales bacterium]